MDVRLERRWGVRQSERHYQILEVAVARLEGCFPLIAFLDPEPVIGIA